MVGLGGWAIGAAVPRPIAADVKADTRKLDSFEAFSKSLTEDTDEQGARGSRRSMSLKSFAEQRREFLLSHIKE